MTKDPVCGMVLDEGRAAALASHHEKTVLALSVWRLGRWLR